MNTEQIFNKYLRQAVKSVTEGVAEHARTHHEFTSRTGNLERSIRSYQSQDGLTGYVLISRAWAAYGVYVHQGYKPFTIVPRNKKALRWVDGSKFVFAKRVRHPGYKGDPFLFNALEAKRKYIDMVFENRVEAAINEILKEM